MKGEARDGRALGRVKALLSPLRVSVWSLAGRRKARRKQELELVKNSSLFDSEWYLRAYPDVAAARVNPLRHYMDVGWREGRDPGPDFATSSYLKANRDVAMAGVNPLLHFVEFGHQEGRGSSTHRPVPKKAKRPAGVFGAAASCVSFPLAQEEPIRWTRGYRLRPRPDLFSRGDCIVGYAPDAAASGQLESAFSLLEALSGYGSAGAKGEQLPSSADRLLDAWYVNGAQLRTRWHSGDFPLIVRAFQHDPLRDGTLCLVGEGLAASPIDVVDLHLKSPFFPVLLVFAEADGTARGTRLLAFPSLCRGGVHYPELLSAAAEVQETDPLAAGELLASRLLRLGGGAESPAVARIEVDITGGDGRGQLFQRDFQLWLERLFKVSIAPIGTTGSRASEFLAEAVTCSPPAGSRQHGGTLRMGHDMVPTIGILVQSSETDGPGAEQVSVPFLVAGQDPSQPALAIEFPGAMAGRSAARCPQLVGGSPVALPAAAIANSVDRDMSDATLLVPIANAAEPAGTRPAITWIVEATEWAEGGLVHAIHALSLQDGGRGDRLSLIGAAEPVAQSIARERFSGRMESFAEMEAAIAASQTPLVGFVGVGVLLHDTGTAARLASHLDDERVETASCAVLDVSQSGAGWHSAVADGGAFATSTGTKLGRPERDSVTAFLWGSAYPVRVPGGHLWLARKASLTAWMEGSQRARPDGMHVCSSEVSASHVGKNPRPQVPAYVPRAGEEQATRVRALFG